MKGGKEIQDKTETDLWPTADHRESLKTPNRPIKKFKDSPKTLSEVNTRNFKKTSKLTSNPSYDCKNRDTELCQETLRSINLNQERGWLPLFQKQFLEPGTLLLFQQPAYVRGLFTRQGTYVRGLTHCRARTPLYFLKKEIKQTDL
jgi:hypothetical protein